MLGSSFVTAPLPDCPAAGGYASRTSYVNAKGFDARHPGPATRAKAFTILGIPVEGSVVLALSNHESGTNAFASDAVPT
jgi:hypothetical protein